MSSNKKEEEGAKKNRPEKDSVVKPGYTDEVYEMKNVHYIPDKKKPDSQKDKKNKGYNKNKDVSSGDAKITEEREKQKPKQRKKSIEEKPPHGKKEWYAQKHQYEKGVHDHPGLPGHNKKGGGEFHSKHQGGGAYGHPTHGPHQGREPYQSKKKHKEHKEYQENIYFYNEGHTKNRSYNHETLVNPLIEQLERELHSFHGKHHAKYHRSLTSIVLREMERGSKSERSHEHEARGGKKHKQKGGFVSHFKEEPKSKEEKDHHWRSNHSKKGKMKKDQKRQGLVPFPPHFSKEEIEEGLKKGLLFKGIFLSNERVHSLASIKSNSHEQRVFLQSLLNQNRALHGNEVVFKLLDLPRSDHSRFDEIKREPVQEGRDSKVGGLSIKESTGYAEEESSMADLQKQDSSHDDVGYLKARNKLSTDTLANADNEEDSSGYETIEEEEVKCPPQTKTVNKRGFIIEETNSPDFFAASVKEKSEKAAKKSNNKRNKEASGSANSAELLYNASKGNEADPENEGEAHDNEESMSDPNNPEEDFELEESGEEGDHDEDDESPLHKSSDDSNENSKLDEFGEFIEEFEEEFVLHKENKSASKEKGSASNLNKVGENKQNSAEKGKREASSRSKLIGTVVAIESNEYTAKDIIGKMENFQNKKAKNKSRYGNFLFRPIDSRLPKMFIKDINKQIANDLMGGKIIPQTTYFVAKYKEWPQDSYYPHVMISEFLGKTGDIEVECGALLREYNVYDKDFTLETFEYLGKFKHYFNDKKESIIPPEERAKRLDLTQELICTVDPATARDLDDALSIKHIRDDIFEIGVHIADVSHFVEEESPLEDDVRLRTTSVYLTHRVIPMLPRMLCEDLCSLNPGVERLAFSCFFLIRKNGQLVENQQPRFAKSVIKSCQKFSYDVVQELIDGKIKDNERLNISGALSKDQLESLRENLLTMNSIAQNRRDWRLKNGSLVFEKQKKRFKLDESFYPIGYTLDERKEANFMVEEYMLLANQLVGRKLVQDCREVALLRKHEAPRDNKLNYLANIMSELNIKIQLNSPETFYSQLNELKADPKINPLLRAVVDFKILRTMEMAKYFVVDDSEESAWHHYALNFDVYTHFTSPIRRYPDLLVHRLLFKTLIHEKAASKHVNKEHMIEIMKKCNECKTNSRKVSDGCEKIFACLYLKKNPVFTKGFVISFSSQSVTLIVPELSLEKDHEKITKVRTVASQGKSSLSIIFSDHPKQKSAYELVLKMHEECELYVSALEKFPIDYKINFVHRLKSENNRELII